MSKVINDETDVLIVGAGPTGLMTACQLAMQGVDFRIVEKNIRKTSYSGAMFIQARTLEVFDQLGIAEQAMRDGRYVEYISFYYQGHQINRIHVAKMGKNISKFPGILMLPQFHTEKILTQYLETCGKTIEREKQLFALEDGPNYVHVKLHTPAGVEQLKCRYVVGTDGIHSTIRELLKISWNGQTNDAPLVVTDCEVQCKSGRKQSHCSTFEKACTEVVFALSSDGIAGFFPLNNHRWRIDSVIPKNMQREKYKSPSFYEITRNFSERIKLGISLKEPGWFSIFHSNTYLAGTLQKGRCFLAGDAAHVHTPIGAQGMNTGMQDAHNLAWKLAFVLKKKVSERILKSYTDERKPVAHHLIRSTDRYFDLAINRDLVTRITRLYVFPLFMWLGAPLLQKAFLQKSFFRRISETGITYRPNILIGKHTFPWTGKRVPYLTWQENGVDKDLHQMISGKAFSLIWFVRNTNIEQRMVWNNPDVNETFADMLEIKIIGWTVVTRHLFKELRINKLGYCLVRPDGHMALFSNTGNIKELEKYLWNLRNE